MGNLGSTFCKYWYVHLYQNGQSVSNQVWLLQKNLLLFIVDLVCHDSELLWRKFENVYLKKTLLSVLHRCEFPQRKYEKHSRHLKVPSAWVIEELKECEIVREVNSVRDLFMPSKFKILCHSKFKNLYLGNVTKTCLL